MNIVAALPSSPGQVLEIGPGKGVLTRLLLERKDLQLKMVEIDPEAALYLQENLLLNDDSLIQGDFLRLDLATLFHPSGWIIGNFPYNISTQILFRVYENHQHVDGLIGMFQREVARRIAAGPGSKEYGILSVLLQSYYQIEYLFTVNEGSFFPAPVVKSGVIRLTRLTPLPERCDKEQLTTLVKAAFNQRRKTLRNALRAIGVNPDTIPGDLVGKRAEQLSVEDFQRLVYAVHAGG